MDRAGPPRRERLGPGPPVRGPGNGGRTGPGGSCTQTPPPACSETLVADANALGYGPNDPAAARVDAGELRDQLRCQKRIGRAISHYVGTKLRLLVLGRSEEDAEAMAIRQLDRLEDDCAVPVVQDASGVVVPAVHDADRLSLDDLKKESVFEGNVQFTQGSLMLRADRVVVRQDEQGFNYAFATGGPAYFRQKREGFDEYIEGFAQRLEYDGKQDKVEMFTEARVKKGIDEVRGRSRFKPWTVLGAGLLVSVVTAGIPLLFGGTVLEVGFWTLELPLIGAVKVSSALAFDVGVYLAVVGLVLMAFEAFGDKPAQPTEVAAVTELRAPGLACSGGEKFA